MAEFFWKGESADEKTFDLPSILQIFNTVFSLSVLLVSFFPKVSVVEIKVSKYDTCVMVNNVINSNQPTSIY